MANKIVILLILGFSSFIFGQEKTYHFLYDFQQKTILTKDEIKYNQKDFVSMLMEEKNRPYEVEVFSNKTNSLIRTVEKLNNSQTGQFLYYGPQPKWYLLDFKTNKGIKSKNDQYINDTIPKINVKPTSNKKSILGIEAKEFIAENEDYKYSFWLGNIDDITSSPIYFQFDGFVVLEATIVSKLVEKEGGENKMHYILKKIDHENINFRKQIPKKYLSIQEADDIYDKIMETEKMGVEKINTNKKSSLVQGEDI